MAEIQVTPLAFESLGVRSMCTLVETRDVTVLLDAGVSLGPRFGLMPHPIEYRKLYELRNRIEESANKADIITISHYHNDHHTPNYIDKAWLGTSPEKSEKIYRDKYVLAKDFRRQINTAQRRRGWMFAQTARKWTSKFETVDNKIFKYGKTTVRFPSPVPHGESETELGWVLPCLIENAKEKIVFAPDVQGPVVEKTLQFILDESPTLLIVGGPPTYLKNYRINDEFFKIALQNMERIVEQVRTVIVDHHLLRDQDWKNYLQPVLKAAKKRRHRVLTAAEFLKLEPDPLEYRRKELYAENPPSQEFLQWTKLSKEQQIENDPPII